MYVKKRPWHADRCSTSNATWCAVVCIAVDHPSSMDHSNSAGPESIRQGVRASGKCILGKVNPGSCWRTWNGVEYRVSRYAQSGWEFWGLYRAPVILPSDIEILRWQPLEANGETRAEIRHNVVSVAASLAAVSWSKDENFRSCCTQAIHKEASTFCSVQNVVEFYKALVASFNWIGTKIFPSLELGNLRINMFLVVKQIYLTWKAGPKSPAMSRGPYCKSIYS